MEYGMEMEMGNKYEIIVGSEIYKLYIKNVSWICDLGIRVWNA